MNPCRPFTALIERRAGLRWLGVVITSAALLLGLLHAPVVHAGNAYGKAKKVANDLQDGLDAGSTPAKNWARDINRVRHVQVLITGNRSDAEMTDLRSNIVGAGGSVHVRFPGLNMVTATVPAGYVAALAARSDVQSVSPNRATQRTASTLEAITLDSWVSHSARRPEPAWIRAAPPVFDPR